jgi:hypothetical protein
VVSVWLVVARFGSISRWGPEAHGAFAEDLGSVSDLFSGLFLPTVSGGASPTLKTGNGESRSWVRIPPHPLFWNGLVPAAELVLRFEALMSRVSLI